MGALLVLDCRRGVGTPRLRYDPNVVHVLRHDIPADVLRQHVRRIVASGDLTEEKVPFSDSILHP